MPIPDQLIRLSTLWCKIRDPSCFDHGGSQSRIGCRFQAYPLKRALGVVIEHCTTWWLTLVHRPHGFSTEELRGGSIAFVHKDLIYRRYRHKRWVLGLWCKTKMSLNQYLTVVGIRRPSGIVTWMFFQILTDLLGCRVKRPSQSSRCWLCWRSISGTVSHSVFNNLLEILATCRTDTTTCVCGNSGWMHAAISRLTALRRPNAFRDIRHISIYGHFETTSFVRRCIWLQ